MNEYKQQIITDFNSRTDYDNDFRYRFAQPLIELAQIKPGQKVLDVATGTGDKLAQLKAEYIAEIPALSTKQGFWQDVNSLFVLARKN